MSHCYESHLETSRNALTYIITYGGVQTGGFFLIPCSVGSGIEKKLGWVRLGTSVKINDRVFSCTLLNLGYFQEFWAFQGIWPCIGRFTPGP